MTAMEVHSTEETPMRIFLDCSNTYKSSSRNGIQRVVRNIVRECESVRSRPLVQCQPVVRVGNRFEVIDGALQQAVLGEEFWQVIRRAYFAVMTPLIKPIPLRFMHRLFLPPPGRRGIFNGVYQLGRMVNMAFHKLTQTLALVPSKIVEMGVGDAIVVMEPCTFKDSWSALDRVRQQGAKVGFVVYDLIPISHSEFCGQTHVRAFENWLKNAAQRADFFVAISDTVRRELKEYLYANTECAFADQQFQYFHLGADLDLAVPEGRTRDVVKTAIGNKERERTFIYVATLEPRKNHSFLLDAFELAWSRNSPARLCIVGRPGSLCHDVIQRIEHHEELGRRLFWIRDASDSELRYCYENAFALVYPSKIEGFGLPLIEALDHGLTVLASDIPIHREVGQDYCSYFKLDNPEQLAEMVAHLLEAPNCLPVRCSDDLHIKSWPESCRDFIAVCLAAVQATPTRTDQVQRSRAA
jgi:alpha-1,2-rhamnosyltransferase